MLRGNSFEKYGSGIKRAVNEIVDYDLPKPKISVQNAGYQILLKKDLRVLKCLQSWVDKLKYLRNINAKAAIIFGAIIILISSVCLI